MIRFGFVDNCASCAGFATRGFCGGCERDLVRVPNPCRTCALAQPVALCPRHYGGWLLERVVAPFAYEPPLDEYIQALKYRAERNLGRALALLLADALRRDFRAVDALVPVPLHPSRLRERGYNQAVEIARTVAAEIEVPMSLRGIRRRRAGTPQSRQTAVERRASMRAAFAVERDFHGATLAIVDDVITTGATANALAAELLAAGAVAVHAWAVARAL
jgi:ComF family protein